MKKSTSLPIILIGLGNPGSEYENTRHNAGREVIRYWISSPFGKSAVGRDLGLKEPTFDAKLQSLITEGKIGKVKIIVALPETFMNRSGKAVEALVKKYKVKPQQVWVIHDDADLLLGRIKIVKNKGSAGHKGVASVMRALKTQDFVRFRLGTGQGTKWHNRDLNKQVIGEWTPREFRIFKNTKKRAAEALTFALKEGLEPAMNIYNR